MSELNPVFRGTYTYGLTEQRMIKRNPLINLIETLIICPFKSLMYSGSSFLRDKYIDKERVIRAKAQLDAIGADSIKLKTPDGALLDAKYLKASYFRLQLEKYFNVVEVMENGLPHQKLLVKEEFCKKIEKKLTLGTDCSYLQPNPEVEAFVQVLKGLGMGVFSNGIISQENNLRGVVIELGHVPKNLPLVTAETKSTVLIAPGADMSYAAYKSLAAAYLLRGMNVLLVDFRGYGESEGSPTSHKTKLDLETAYQYLREKKHIENNDLVVHGHCMGGGSATDLAARRTGVNLILDRSFSDYRDVAKNRFPLISEIIYRILPWIINYNNAENLAKIVGHIAIAMANEDAVISKEQTMNQIDSLPNTKPGQVVKLIDTAGGHSGIWTENAITSDQFNQFLTQTHLRGRLF